MASAVGLKACKIWCELFAGGGGRFRGFLGGAGLKVWGCLGSLVFLGFGGFWGDLGFSGSLGGSSPESTQRAAGVDANPAGLSSSVRLSQKNTVLSALSRYLTRFGFHSQDGRF